MQTPQSNSIYAQESKHTHTVHPYRDSNAACQRDNSLSAVGYSDKSSRYGWVCVIVGGVHIGRKVGFSLGKRMCVCWGWVGGTEIKIWHRLPRSVHTTLATLVLLIKAEISWQHFATDSLPATARLHMILINVYVAVKDLLPHIHITHSHTRWRAGRKLMCILYSSPHSCPSYRNNYTVRYNRTNRLVLWSKVKLHVP